MAKYYYNGVLLPEIPTDVLAEYPYCWIRKDTTTGYYDLIFSKSSGYLTDGGESLRYRDNTSKPWYTVPISTAENENTWVYSKTSSGTSFGFDTTYPLLWSNHDIFNYNGTIVLFEGTKPVPEANLVLTNKSTLTSIADSIRAKTGKTEQMYISQMPDEIREIGNSGNEGEEEDLAAMIGPESVDIYNESVIKIRDYGFYYNSGVRSVEFPNCETIGANGFYKCSSLTSADFPNCTYIGNNAFSNCSLLSFINFPNCETIRNQAFRYCSSLIEADFPACTAIENTTFDGCTSLSIASFPVCTTIGSSAFQNCSSLTEINFPACTTIGSSAFQYCTALTSVSFPNCVTLGQLVFASCTSLIEANFPACTTIGAYVFSGCSSLTEVNFPVCTTIGNSVFGRCSALTSVSFPVCISIGAGAFSRCSSLITLTLGASSVASLGGTNAFASTPMSVSTLTGSFGSIYVPASLVDSYKAATNWSVYADRITAIVE